MLQESNFAKLFPAEGKSVKGDPDYNPGGPLLLLRNSFALLGPVESAANEAYGKYLFRLNEHPWHSIAEGEIAQLLEVVHGMLYSPPWREELKKKPIKRRNIMLKKIWVYCTKLILAIQILILRPHPFHLLYRWKSGRVFFRHSQEVLPMFL